jgi:hypothetical protein
MAATSMRYRLGIVVGLLAFAAPQSLRAEIIIDEFDAPLQIELPEMENESVSTAGVGVLNAVRSIGVTSSQTDPIGNVDVHITRASHITARIDGQFLDNPLNTPLLAFGAAYDFDGPMDLTEGGVNNAIFLDITVFQGSGIPSDLSILVRDANDTFAANISRFSLLSNSPYTIAVPFRSFGFRGGGGIGQADFTTVDLLGVTVRLLQGSRNPDTNWFVQIDRISVGRTVPEPGTLKILILTVLLAAALCIRRP